MEQIHSSQLKAPDIEKGSRFFELPAEIRDQVYSYLELPDRVSHISRPGYRLRRSYSWSGLSSGTLNLSNYDLFVRELHLYLDRQKLSHLCHLIPAKPDILCFDPAVLIIIAELRIAVRSTEISGTYWRRKIHHKVSHICKFFKELATIQAKTKTLTSLMRVSKQMRIELAAVLARHVPQDLHTQWRHMRAIRHLDQRYAMQLHSIHDLHLRYEDSDLARGLEENASVALGRIVALLRRMKSLRLAFVLVRIPYRSELSRAEVVNQVWTLEMVEQLPHLHRFTFCVEPSILEHTRADLAGPAWEINLVAEKKVDQKDGRLKWLSLPFDEDFPPVEPTDSA